MLDRPDITVTIRLPRELSSRLDRTATDFDLTRGELIRRALSDYLSAPDDAEIFGRSDLPRSILT